MYKEVTFQKLHQEGKDSAPSDCERELSKS